MEKPLRKEGVLLIKNIDNSILFDQESGKVYRINNTMSEIWNLCNGKNTIDSIAEQMIQKYNVPTIKIKGDITNMLKYLKVLKLIGDSK